MSKFILSLLFFAVPFFACSQSAPDSLSVNDTTIYTEVDSVAHFPGTKQDLYKFIAGNLNANTPVDNSAPDGTWTVVIKFVVTKDGTLKDFKAETNHGYGLEKEVIRMLKRSPKWVPAIKNGVIVNSVASFPQTFRVTSEKSGRRRK